MLDSEPNDRHDEAGTDRTTDTPVTEETTPKRRTRTRKSASSEETPAEEPAEKSARRRRKVVAEDTAPEASGETQPTEESSAVTPRASHSVLFMAPTPTTPPAAGAAEAEPEQGETLTRRRRRRARGDSDEAHELVTSPIAEEQETEAEEGGRKRRRSRSAPVAEEETEAEESEGGRKRRRSRSAAAVVEEQEEEEPEGDEDEGGRRRRRGRRGRGRGKGTLDDNGEPEEETSEADGDEPEGEEGEEAPLTRRRRRRRRKGEADADGDGDVHTVVKIRERRKENGGDEVQGVSGSTRLEAKRQRRRDGREQRRTRPPILTEAEFLARREAVDRVMVIRDSGDRTQIAVLEDGVLVEHYVTKASASTMVGNVYLGKVQNVLPSMEAAFVDLGRGRNAVLYAGEVNWDAAGLEGKARSIEQALKSGDTVLVQVTKDPVGHKGARLSSHIALSGRHLVYVPHGNTSGISRKLSDVERRRLRDILKKLVPEGAGVIVRTAAEGASEEDLERDTTRLQAQWEEIQAKAAEGGAPVLLYAEPELVLRVVRDLFNEDFKELIIQGDVASETVENYLSYVSPDLVGRVRRYTGAADVFAAYRIDEQILKGLDRKVFLPSGGHLVIDRTEAMTVVDVNTGKYTGAGGNLEETVTRNNLEAAEEIVRQLRLRDLGGIVVIDFIDMVLESNRELVLRRLTECLGRDRTKHQVTEITSLGLVQMTRKRIGAGLLEAFSEPCEHCKGRGVVIHMDPLPDRKHHALPPAAAKEIEAPKAKKQAEPFADTEGYDLSRYGNGEDEDLESADDEHGGTQVRRRTRRGGRRRTRI